MLLSLTPEAPLPTILFTLTFPSPLPDPLPLPVAWDSHLQIVNNLQLSSPPDVHALDKSAAWVSLIDTVNFDLGTLVLTCTFIDHSKEEWPLSSSCVILLEKVISDVNRSTTEAETEAEDCHNPSTGSPLNSISAPNGGGGYAQKQSVSTSASTLSGTNGNPSTTTVVTVKTPKPKKRRSILAALVASLVPLPTSRSVTPTSRPSSPSARLPSASSDNSLRGSVTVSPSPSSQNVQPQQEIITPPPGVPLSRFLRRRARSTLVDAFRRFVLPELSMRYRSGMARTNPQVTLPFGGPFYALWATRSMMRSIVTEMGRMLMSSNKGSDAISSASSSPLNTPIGGPGDPLDDCTTTDESSVHSIPEQVGLSIHGVISKTSPLISARLRRKINPELSQEAYDTYTSLRETYIRLRNLSSQLEAHVQAENHIECDRSHTESGTDGEMNDSNDASFADFFHSACPPSDQLASPSGLLTQRQVQLTSAEIKSQRRAWSTRTYLVNGWETYRGSPSRRPLSGHKRSYSEPAPSTLRGGSPISLIGLSTPARPSPLSQMWVHEPEEEDPLVDFDDDFEDEGVYIGSAGRGKSKWSWSFEVGRKHRGEGFLHKRLPVGSGSGHRRERCVSMISPPSSTGSTPMNRKAGSKLKPNVRPDVALSSNDRAGMGSGFSRVRFPENVDANDSVAVEEEEEDYNDDEEFFEESYGVDIGIHEVDFETSGGGDDDETCSRIQLASGRIVHSVNRPVSRDDEQHFDSQSYKHNSRALTHFRYGYGAEFYPTESFQHDVFAHGDDAELGLDESHTDLDYGYSRPRRTSNGNYGDAAESGLYRKPSLEEFILPHPRTRVNSGLDVANAPLLDDVIV